MNRIDVHRAWARSDARWSEWVKPVLFATLDDARIAEVLARNAPPHAPPFDVTGRLLAPLDASAPTAIDPYRTGSRLLDVALVIDLPGARGIELGVALVTHGFAPIPLYNALPAAVADATVEAIVDVEPIIDGLVAGADIVSRASLDAPPAFLLDANRLGDERALTPGLFDNRSASHPSDFPSADMLWSRGIRRAVLVSEHVATDLESTIDAWQRRGIAWWRLDLGTTSRAEPVMFRRRNLLSRALSGLSAMRRPAPRADGSYGHLVLPPPSAS